MQIAFIAAAFAFGAIVAAALSDDAPRGKPHPYLTLASLAPTREYDVMGPAGDWLLSWDGSRRVAWYTVERLTVDSFGDAKRGDLKFHHDAREQPEFPSSPDDWNGFTSRYDRFHLAAAGNHSRTPANLKATFTVRNAAVGDKLLNEGLWGRLEEHVRSLIADEETIVWVVTLCVWTPDGYPKSLEKRDATFIERSIGENHLRVPPYFAKSVLVQRRTKITMRTWLVPNAEPPEGKTFEDFVETADYVEGVAGLNLWPGLSEETQKELEAVK
jgi:endonuclease G